MAYLLVPLEPSQASVRIWVGIVGETPGSVTLTIGDSVRRDLVGGWTEMRIRGEVQVRAQRVDVGGLEPGIRYAVRLEAGGVVRDQAIAPTLPEGLPGLDRRPFTCLVGSCFGRLADEEGAAGAAVSRLPAWYVPDVTFLCGDQVYLDAPFARFLLSLQRGEDLKAALLQTYLATWLQDGPGVGYAQVLRSGATLFTSDDHELWNNGPSKSPAVINSWFAGPREELRAVATGLYDLFQASARSATFRVGRMSVLVLDTRMDRTADRSTLVPAPRMADVGRWVDALTGPGVLVLGQPIFADEAGWKGHLFDWGLPDFAQYAELVRSVQRSRHDIVVLTGDVHYGRVARCVLPSGAQLLEVIASPFALVDEKLGRGWHAPPASFPSFPIPGTLSRPVSFEGSYREMRDHFATVGFNDAGTRLRMDVTAWPIPAPGTALAASHAFSVDLA